MPLISPEEKANGLERERRILNTRLGYEKSLRDVLSRFMDKGDVDKAMRAAHNRDFNKFKRLTTSVKKS